MVELPTGVVSQHYHDISEAEEEVPLIGLQDTLHLISLKLEHTGGLKVITEFHYLS